MNTSAENQSQAGGQVVASSAVTGSNSGIRAYSVNLAADQVLTREVLPEGFKLDVDTGLLPNLMGFGHISDLRVAMTRDDNLKQLLEDFVNKDRGATFASYISDARGILFAWAGIANVDPQSRGSQIDAREIAVVEKLVDIQYPASLSPTGGIGPAVKEYFSRFFEGFMSRLLEQSWESKWMLRQIEDPLALAQNDVLFDPLILLSGGNIEDGRNLVMDISSNIAALGAAQSNDSPLTPPMR